MRAALKRETDAYVVAGVGVISDICFGGVAEKVSQAAIKNKE